MAMLRIINRSAVNEDRWILSGQLAGPWVEELRSNWDQVLDRSPAPLIGRRFVIDLSDVTCVDASGEGLLGELRDEGAEFVATGVYIKHLLENLKSRQWNAY
jgi:hypothetical protein